MNENYQIWALLLLPVVGCLLLTYGVMAIIEGDGVKFCNLQNYNIFCIPVSLFAGALGLAALPGAILLWIAEVFYSGVLGIDLSFWNFTFVIICANIFCFIRAYSDFFAMKAATGKQNGHSSLEGSSSTSSYQSNDDDPSSPGEHTELPKSGGHTSSGHFLSEIFESSPDQTEKGWLDLGPDVCPHCDGNGICQDDYHSGGPGIVTDLVIGANCPSGCSGSSIGAGQCPHCNGSGKDE